MAKIRKLQENGTTIYPVTDTKAIFSNGTRTKLNDELSAMNTNIDSKARTATVVVAASNSTQKSKDAADYVCDGTADQSEITSALSALQSTGGKIVFLEGTYSISSEFTISKNVVFEGMGDATSFSVSGSFARTSSAINVTFRDIKITANSISKYLYKGGGSDNVLLDNVTLTMTATGAHNLQTADTQAAFINSKSFTAVKSRITVGASSSIHTSSVVGCFAVAEIAASSDVSGSVNISDCRIDLNGQYGRIHIVRKYMHATNCNIFSQSDRDTSNCGVIGGLGNMISDSTINFGGTVSISNFDAPITDGHFVNTRLYAPKAKVYGSGGHGSRFVCCLLHNVSTLSSESSLNAEY